MGGRKIRSSTDAESCLSAVAASGLSRVAWCHANGVDARSLNAWRLNLARQGRRASGAEAGGALRLVELVPQAQARSVAPALMLQVGGVTIGVPVGFDARTLERLLELVAPC